MGMYTELVLKVQIKTDIPEDVEQILLYLFNRNRWKAPKALPDHPFFRMPQWSLIGEGSSYYHVPFATSAYKEGYIFSRSDLKSSSAIASFIDWLTPYIAIGKGQCIGWEWYEEDVKPTLLFL